MKKLGVKLEHRGSYMFMSVEDYDALSFHCGGVDQDQYQQAQWDALELCDYWDDELHLEDPDYA